MQVSNTFWIQLYYHSTKTQTAASSTLKSASSGAGGDNKQWIHRTKSSNSSPKVCRLICSLLHRMVSVAQVDWSSSLVAGVWMTKLPLTTTPSSINTVLAPSSSAIHSASVVDQRSAGRSIRSVIRVNKPHFSPRSVFSPAHSDECRCEIHA